MQTCQKCNRIDYRFWPNEKGEFLCAKCCGKNFLCVTCGREFSKPTSGVIYFSKHKTGWYCWQCLDKECYAEDDKKEHCWQVCEIEFEEVTNDV